MPHALWDELAARANVALSDEQTRQLHQYIDLLLAANERMNLTRIADRAAAEVGHVGDALTILPFLPTATHQLVDVGSGGGVPGLPLAIARPDAAVLLIESTQKKAAFLAETAKTLGLTNVRVSPMRAEDAGFSPSRDRFDVAVARAVGAMAFLAEWCLPLVKKGGKFLAMKGARITEELPAAAVAIKAVGGGAPVVHPVSLPGAEHHVVVEIRKVGPTPSKYPRRATQAKGKPLI